VTSLLCHMCAKSQYVRSERQEYRATFLGIYCT
jgi:hypothetical protein